MLKHRKIAVLFIGIFVSMVLMKPVHFIFVDHDHHCSATSDCNSKTESEGQHNDCCFCLFSFQNFTPHTFAHIRHNITTYVVKLVAIEYIVHLQKLISDISTRGPPLLHHSSL